jgi:hypothetical protein
MTTQTKSRSHDDIGSFVLSTSLPTNPPTSCATTITMTSSNPPSQMPPTDTSKSKPLSISFGKPKTATSSKPSAPLSKRPPPTLLSKQDSDDEGSDEAPRLETVTHFDTAGARNGVRKEKEEKLIIKSQGNQDWRKRGRNLLPPELQARQQGQNRGDAGAQVETIEVAKEGGLKFAQKVERTENGAATDVEMADAEPLRDDTPTKPKTDDERALDALLSDGQRARSDLVIPQNELSVFRSDVSTRPESASLADYAAVPVEEFGAAMLRGMGWKEGEEYSTRWKNRYAADGANGEKKVKREVERRPALLGIGAKSEGVNGGAELGAWGKADMRKAAYGKKDGKSGGDGLYNPVLLKDKRTGEMVSEEELKLRKLEALEGPKKSESDRERRRSRSRDRDRDDRDKRRDRDAYRERSRDRDRDRRKDKERDRSGERSHKNGRKDRDYEDDSDERYYREKERDRRKRYADDDKYESSLSRRGHKERDSHRDRDGRRDRHRDDRRDYDRDKKRKEDVR